MTEVEREDTRRRLRLWQEAQPMLEEQRWLGLRALTDEIRRASGSRILNPV